MFFCKLALFVLRYVSSPVGVFLRRPFYKLLLKSCGFGFDVYDGVIVKNFHNISVGNDVHISQFCFINAESGIVLGNDVMVAPKCSIVSFNRRYDRLDLPIRKQDFILKPIVIDDDVWLCTGAIVLAGVHIGRGSIIGAGSVVTRDIPPFSVAVGNPARVIKSRVML